MLLTKEKITNAVMCAQQVLSRPAIYAGKEEMLAISIDAVTDYIALTYDKKIVIREVNFEAVHHNFVRVHKSLRMTPAMAAGVTKELHDMEWLVGIIDAAAPAPKPRGPYKKRNA